MTVAELKTLLADVPDDLQVLGLEYEFLPHMEVHLPTRKVFIL